MSNPTWTVIIDVESMDYVSQLRLFYDKEENAKRTYNRYGGTMRPYDKSDKPWLRDYTRDDILDAKKAEHDERVGAYL